MFDTFVAPVIFWIVITYTGLGFLLFLYKISFFFTKEGRDDFARERRDNYPVFNHLPDNLVIVIAIIGQIAQIFSWPADIKRMLELRKEDGDDAH